MTWFVVALFFAPALVVATIGCACVWTLCLYALVGVICGRRL